MKKSLQTIAVVFIVLANIGCAKVNPIDEADINELSHSERYNQIIDRFPVATLCKIESPRKLSLYIQALIETGKRLPAELQTSSCSSHVREFALGYYAMLHGELNDSLLHFTAIRSSNEATIWTSIAFLEYALYTEDLSKYEMFIQALNKIASQGNNDLLKEYLPYYEIKYLLISGKLDEARKILSEYSSVLGSYDQSVLEIDIYIREDKFDEAIRVINRQLKKYPANQELLELNGEIIRLTQGNNAWVSYLREIVDRYPNVWLIELNYAIGLIELGQKERGLRILEKISKQRPFDYRVQLLLVDNSILYGKDIEIKNIQDILNNGHYFQLPYYHVILSKMLFISGQISEMDRHLRDAKELNPYADYVLWAEFDQLNERMKYKDAETVLDKMHKLWPNAVNVLHEKYTLAVKQNETSKAQAIEKLLRKSKRHIPFKYGNERGDGVTH